MLLRELTEKQVKEYMLELAKYLYDTSPISNTMSLTYGNVEIKLSITMKE